MTFSSTHYWPLVELLALGGLAAGTTAAQPITKATGCQPDRQSRKRRGRISRLLELKRRGENASAANSTAQGQNDSPGVTLRTDSQKATAESRKDDLDDALGDLNRSTNRLRRKFDATDTWMETKVQVEQVMGNARRINQVVARGKYGARSCTSLVGLRSGINSMARAYGLQPLAV